MDNYIFPAIFEACEEGGYTVTFPDLIGCITEGDNLKEAMKMAKEVLELYLYNIEDDGEEIPQASKPEKVDISKGCFVSPVNADMILIRKEMDNKSVKKTLTIPSWLNKLAEENKINFSQILQESLKKKLNFK